MTESASGLITLQNAEVSLGILPALAGRMVSLQFRQGPNLLFAPPEDWQNWPSTRPALDEPPRWVPYQGHITWLGPQSEWWNHQDRFPDLRGQVWPPDPYWEYAPTEIIQQSEQQVEMVGPPSPFTGLQLRQEITVNHRSVQLKVVARNHRPEPVAWDIWTNTRISPTVPTSVPVARAADVRWDTKSPTGLPAAVAENRLVYRPRADAPALSAKAFVYPTQAEIAAEFPDCILIKRTALYSKDEYHPEQAPVEIYLDTDPTKPLQEIEFHGVFRTLLPNEEMNFLETWDLHSPGSNELPEWFIPTVDGWSRQPAR